MQTVDWRQSFILSPAQTSLPPSLSVSLLFQSLRSRPCLWNVQLSDIWIRLHFNFQQRLPLQYVRPHPLPHEEGDRGDGDVIDRKGTSADVPHFKKRK